MDYGTYKDKAAKIWDSLNQPKNFWLFMGVLGLALLLVDTWIFTGFTRSLLASIQDREPNALDTLFALGISLSISSSQIVLWALWTRRIRIERLQERQMFIVFALLGAILNFVATVVVLMAGFPTGTLNVFIETARGIAVNPIGGFIVYLFALLVSFLPEFLLHFGLHLRQEQTETQPQLSLLGEGEDELVSVADAILQEKTNPTP